MDKPDLGPLESAALQIISIQLTMTEEQRLHFWSVIQHGYCKDCGRYCPGATCMCNNDE